MFSYRHSFHASNRADALKHTVRSLITEPLKEKDEPLLYLDTHAEAGRYQLGSEYAECTDEYPEGIARIWRQGDSPTELETYINVIKHFNCNGQLRYYPDSPLITRQLLREQDSLQLTELRPSGYPLLRPEFQRDGRARVGKANGLQQPKAGLPPALHHGLILINLSYGAKTDCQAVVSGVTEGYKCFTTGTYALWYPVVLRQQIKRMIRDLKTIGTRKVLQIELAVLLDSDRRGVTASGMIVISLPWKLEQQMNNVLPWLHSKLIPVGTGYVIVSWIMLE